MSRMEGVNHKKKVGLQEHIALDGTTELNGKRGYLWMPIGENSWFKR